VDGQFGRADVTDRELTKRGDDVNKTGTALGHGLLLQDGDLVLSGGALAEVAGVANLAQALTLRVLTPYGTDLFNTRYGLSAASALTRPNSLRMVKELLRLELVRTIGADPRVSDVVQVLFDDDPAYLRSHPGAAADRRVRRSWAVEVDVEMVSGGSATLLVDVEV
jgi:hypothetical protein